MIIFTIITTLVFLYFSKKTNILVDVKNQKHKSYVSKKNNYIIGGIIFIIYWIYLFFFDYQTNIKDYKIYLVCFLFFLIGICSDFKILENPLKRFFLQGLVLFLFILYFNFSIPLSGIGFFDFFLKNIYFNKCFTIFCLMILINGYNFIDGINTLLIGYNIVICTILLFFFNENLQDVKLLKDFLIITLILLLFNFNGNIILGDSGSYAMGIFVGIYLIIFSANNFYLSPLFIISLIWYPCFELLFSMIRRYKSKNKMYKPDTKHFHQLLYKFFNKNEKNNFICHFYVSIIINFYCFFILIFNILFGLKTSQIAIFLFINILIYLFTYRKLSKFI